MYAVFEDGSRQYRVSEGEVVKVDFRAGDGDGAAPGTAVEFPRVLLYRKDETTHLGQPVVEGARILGEVVDHPSIKTYIQHFRRRKNYRRLRGHRQFYTAVRVKHILLAGQEPPTAAPPSPAPTQQAPAPEAPPAPPPPPAPTQQAPAPEAPPAPAPAPAPAPEATGAPPAPPAPPAP